MPSTPRVQMSGRILVVEDLAVQAELARLFLAGLGYDVRIASTAGAALEMVRAWQPDGLLLDIELPDFNGLELMRRLQAMGNDAVVVIVTASASMEMAKQAIRAGAEDYVVKPYNKDRLSITLRNALGRRSLARTRQSLESQLNETQSRLRDVEAKLGRSGFLNFVGASGRMRAVYDIIQSVASSKASVFITGESGTGKELAAEALHKASPRAAGAFVALNCAAIPRDLLESEVFGHVRGAFTGATSDRIGAAKLADGGTLFLDEIVEMPLDMQVKLLRFVQTGTFTPVGGSKLERVDVRFVCATNRDPMLEVQGGRFREDLYYRLYVVPVELPPLRDRGHDILLIARHFLDLFSQEEGRRFRGFTAEAERLLLAYGWPGNVRQLQNVVRNIVVLHDGDLVTVGMIPPPVGRTVSDTVSEPCSPPFDPAVLSSPPLDAVGLPDVATAAEPDIASSAQAPEPAVTTPDATCSVAAGRHDENADDGYGTQRTMPGDGASPYLGHAGVSRPDLVVVPEMEIIPLAEMERRMILAALARTGNDVPRAAAMLQINPSTIYRKMSVWRKEGLIP
ncbi:MAG TPA: sigma-54 dependent transcriptional regulator [Rhodopila sp.]|nr:sigma-54 dependent transcriptional regulator [Rhodopila sp.]